MVFNGGVVAYYCARQFVVALCTVMKETIALAKMINKIQLQSLQLRGNDFTHQTWNVSWNKLGPSRSEKGVNVQRKIILIAYNEHEHCRSHDLAIC